MAEIENPIIDILFAENREPDWLIRDFMLQGTMTCLAGEPNAGKSYVSYMIGLCLAAGLPLFGNLIPASEPKRVLYFDEENSKGDRDTYLRRAFQGLVEQYGREPNIELLMENFWPIHFQLGSEDWKDVAAFNVEQIQPHCMMFDTATPAFNIEDENSNAEATKAIKDVRDLMHMTDPVSSSIILKHAKMRTEKGGRRTMRGAKAWQGAADAVMFQVKATGRPRKDGLSLTRLEPDKVRAHGLRQTIYISPEWTDDDRNGLMLTGSYSASKDHRAAEREEDSDD